MNLGTGSNAQPFIGRLRASTKPIVFLNAQQIAAIAEFREAIRERMYSFSANPCICGGLDNHIIACRDRYGLNVRTVLCRSCGLLRTDPYLDKESMLGFYGQHYRSIYAEDSQDFQSFFVQQLRRGEAIIRTLEKHRIAFPGRVLEVGCGAGGILEAFREWGAQVAGCDLGESLLEYGREKGLSLKYGEAEALSNYPPADLVILAHVLEHFRNPVEELRKISRLLSDIGYLYIEVPGLFWIEKAYQRDLGRYLQNAHVYHFCLESLDYVLSLAGFSRVWGDEQIFAVYHKRETPILLPARLSEKTLDYFRKIDRLRIIRNLGSRVRSRLSWIY